MLLLLVACSNRAEIDGRVVNALDGSPVSAVTLTVAGTTTTATSDAEGRYHLADVVPGPQRVLATRDGFLALAPLELTTAAREEVAATDLRMVPRPPAPGLYASVAGALVPMRSVEESKLGSYFLSGAHFLDAKVARSLPQISAPAELLLWPGDGAPATLEVVVSPLIAKAATQNFYGGAPARYDVSDDRVNVQLEDIGAGLTRLTGTLAPGRYCVRRRHAFGVPDGYDFFEVLPGPAELVALPEGGRALKVANADYPISSQQWNLGRDLMLEWCAGPAAPPECASVAAAFKAAVPEEGCPGVLRVNAKGAELSTTECTGGSHASFRRQAGLLRVEKVWEEEVGD